MIARLIEWCARHRARVFLVTALASIAAVFAIRRIPLDAIPDLSDPQVIVFTEWMGRSPDLVEDQVTYPIASSLLGSPRVEAVRGQSMFGMSFITVVFHEGTDPYWARSRVLETISTLRSRLPDGVSPVLGPDASSVGWVFEYALVDTSGAHDLAQLRALQDFQLRYALTSVPGVAEVASVGGYPRQYQVEVDPARLHAFGLSLTDVVAAIRRSNAEVGGRVIEMAGREVFVRGRGYVTKLDDLRQVAVGVDRARGTPIRVADVGTVSFGPDIRRGVAELDGEGETVGGIVVMRHGENALAVIGRVKHRLAELTPTLPPGVSVKIVYDRSELIRRSIDTLRRTLFEEALVVSVVIFLFLLHVRSTLIPVLVLPVAVGLAFLPMWALGVDSNIMSLGGIAIAIGAMVDAAIVLVENAHKHLESAPADADRTAVVIAAVREVGPPVFFSLLIITVSFLPIFGLNGQAGRLFRPLAFTKTFAMGFAALASVTLAPALMTLLLRGRIRRESEHPVSRALIGLYRPFAWVALKNPRTTIVIGLAALVSALPMAARLGGEFMPPLDEGDLLYMPTTLPNISIEGAKRSLQVQDQLIRGVPEVASVFGKAGRAETPTDPAPLSMVETVVQLKPRDQWRRLPLHRWYSDTAPRWTRPALRVLWPDTRRIRPDELVEELNRTVQLPGWTNAWTRPIKARIDMLSTGIRTPVGIKIYGADLDSIERVGIDLEHVLAALPGTRSVYSERNTGGTYLDIIPDRDALSRYGLTVGDVQDVIEGAIGGQPIQVATAGRERFTISVRYPRESRSDIEQLRHVLVPIPAARAARGRAAGMGAMIAPDTPLRDAVGRPAFLADAAMSDAGGAMPRAGGMRPGEASADQPSNVTPSSSSEPSESGEGTAHVPLGQLAELRIVNGPPMVRDEGGRLVGYVVVDVDPARRDIAGYVAAAQRAVSRELRLPAGVDLQWTGQYELLQQMEARMRWLIPLTVLIVVMLLMLHFGDLARTLIVLCSLPFALIGSVWLLALLHYPVSTAVWVGLIALMGLAAQTGVVMIVYCDAAFERWRREGRLHTLDDVIEATLDGAVQRVRPKVMTVATVLIGLLPLLWSQGSGADVMKRVAVPMVGGLVTSAFLTLEIIPVVYAHWRWGQLRRGSAR